MAEAFLRRYAGDRFEVFSAGLEPTEIDPHTRLVMEEVGIDLSEHTAKGLVGWLGRKHFGYVITVCSRAEQLCPILPGVSVRLYWPFDDPLESAETETEKLKRFRKVRDEIYSCVQTWVEEVNED
jgi:arsenate reductase